MEKEITQEQIAAWKKQFGDIFKIEVDGKICILHKPDRKALAYAMSEKNQIRQIEILLANCWIEGDEEIKTDTSLFLSVSQNIAAILELKQSEISKL